MLLLFVHAFFHINVLLPCNFVVLPCICTKPGRHVFCPTIRILEVLGLDFFNYSRCYGFFNEEFLNPLCPCFVVIMIFSEIALNFAANWSVEVCAFQVLALRIYSDVSSPPIQIYLVLMFAGGV
jgi:hypothetical protein